MVPKVSDMGSVITRHTEVMMNVFQAYVSVPELPMVEANALVEFWMSTGEFAIQDAVQLENPSGPAGVVVFIFIPKKLVANESGRYTAAMIVKMKLRRLCVSSRCSRRVCCSSLSSCEISIN